MLEEHNNILDYDSSVGQSFLFERKFPETEKKESRYQELINKLDNISIGKTLVSGKKS